MHYLVVGLGNPGEEYEHTRHNIGRAAVEAFAKVNGFSAWEENKKAKAHYTHGTIGKHKTELLLPDTFMNKSGSAAKTFVKSKKAAERMVVVHDDIDLPVGTIRIVFGRGSGGHKGVESIVRAVKTKEFVRVRVGVSQKSAKGAARKPQGDKAVQDFILKKMQKKDVEMFTNVFKTTTAAIETIIKDGRTSAMNEFN